MEPEQKEIVPDFGPKIKAEQARWLARIARDQRVEPFFGNRGLELVKTTRGGIEKGMVSAKDATLGAGRWLGGLKWVREGKEKISAALSAGETPEWFTRFDKATEELRQRALSWGGKMGGASGDWSLAVLKWGFELVLYEDTEAWALGRVNRLMPQAKVTTLAQMALLEEVQREAVIAEYYPYDNPTLKRFSKSLDWSLNLALGATAASQLPGSGLAAGLANLAKTLIKLAGRISSMSAVYGYHIPSAEHLFVACAKILKSIEDFESNPEHLPLNLRDFATLYDPVTASDEGFGEMLKEALKKEAYMAVPGVGVISLGKIGLDDLMVDQMVLHLVGNVFWLGQLETDLGAERVAALLDRWSAIYGALLDTDWFGQPSQAVPGRGWQERLWAWNDAGEALSARSAALDFEANRLFEELLALSGPEFWQELLRQVKPLEKTMKLAAPPGPKPPTS
ncbi:MAG: hypothetical protein RRB13_11480 [bacterium]|nr:hypothetical protein [bacterium]